LQDGLGGALVSTHLTIVQNVSLFRFLGPSRFRRGGRLGHALAWCGLVVLGTAVSPGWSHAQHAAQGASASARAAAARPEPGDRLVLKVWREPLLRDTALIDERGEVILPKIGSIDVTGHTIATLQDTIRARYARYLRDPGIDVQVLRRVAVNGEVRRPNVYHLDLTMTLRDVIAHAGGITDNGNHKSVWLVRNGVRSRVANWDNDDTVASDLKSGDQVVVGRRSWIHQNAISVATVGVMLTSIVISAVK
jgi:protein involved in polysaccharide export with SLBB domain